MKKFIFCLIPILILIISSLSLADIVFIDEYGNHRGHGVANRYRNEVLESSMASSLMDWILPLMIIIIAIIIVVIIIVKLKKSKNGGK